MYAYIPGLHMEGLALDDVLLASLQNDQDLLRLVPVQGEHRSRWLLDETEQHPVAEHKPCPNFIRQRN
ncbi:MAG: hypothetical protein GX493_08695 [Firmicutes bacterium]|nr:hypothetical protein [Bacillota bacterium]